MVAHQGSSTDLYRIVQEIQYHIKVQFKNFHLNGSTSTLECHVHFKFVFRKPSLQNKPFYMKNSPQVAFTLTLTRQN